MEAERAIDAAIRDRSAYTKDHGLGEHELFKANNRSKLHAQLESFLHQLKFHFYPPTDDQPH